MKNIQKYLSLAIVFLLLTSSSFQTGIPKAQSMFIYNFSRLIEWPASYKTGPFIIGVIGSSATLKELQAYTANKSVGSQSITVKRFNTPAEIGKCNILFVPFSKTKLLPEITKVISGKSTLIVGEKNGAIDLGAALNFIVVGDKLKFEIKPSNATSRGIKMSSKLNEMAFKVY